MRIQIIDQNKRDAGIQQVLVRQDADGTPFAVKIFNAGDEYWATGKTGTSFADRKEMIEMGRNQDSERIWVAKDLSRIELD